MCFVLRSRSGGASDYYKCASNMLLGSGKFGVCFNKVAGRGETVSPELHELVLSSEGSSAE